MELNEWMNYLRSLSGSSRNSKGENSDCPDTEVLNSLLDKVAYSHRWFTRQNLDFALDALCNAAAMDGLDFSFSEKANGKTLGFWMRPLSPFDGQDLILLSLNAGFRCLIRTSETEAILYKGIIGLLENRFPNLKGRTEFVDRPSGGVDAWVITGEAPTAAQLAYFAKRPVFVDTVDQHLATAVLTGGESPSELDALAEDLCMFFGRSKYNVSKLVVPAEYDFSALLKSLESYRENGNHSGYFNHYEYRKAAYIVGSQPVIDNGFLIIKKETGDVHSIGVVYYIESRENEISESDLTGRQLCRAQPEILRGELAFGSVCKQNFKLAGEFLLFLKEI